MRPWIILAEFNLQISKYFILQFLHVGIQSGSGVHLPSVGNRQQPQAKPDQVSTSTQPLAGANNLELGELEQLTITNDNESSYDVSYLYSSGVIRIKKHNVFAFFPIKLSLMCYNIQKIISDYNTIPNKENVEC